LRRCDLGVLTAIDHIVVGNHAIRIIGGKETLARVVAGESTRANVRSVELKWRALRDEDANLYMINIMT
jgi:hypothetical protein